MYADERTMSKQKQQKTKPHRVFYLCTPTWNPSRFT